MPPKSIDLKSDENLNKSNINYISPGVINSISPLNIRAGTNETITISGTGFGQTKKYVWLPNAEKKGARHIKIPDKFVTWSDIKVVVKLPGWILGNTSCTSDEDGFHTGLPGTGQVILTNDGGCTLNSANYIAKVRLLRKKFHWL